MLKKIKTNRKKNLINRLNIRAFLKSSKLICPILFYAYIENSYHKLKICGKKCFLDSIRHGEKNSDHRCDIPNVSGPFGRFKFSSVGFQT